MSNLRPQTISVPVNDGKTVINYDIFVDSESGLDVDPQSGDMRTREQTIEMVQSVYSVGAETMSDELDRYNKWIQDPENKAKSQKLMTSNQPVPGGNSNNKNASASSKNTSSSAPTAATTIFTPEMALQKAADCRKRGNDWLVQKEFRKALKVYSEGLAYLHVSQRCGMLLSNRAEVLLKMLRFEEAAAGAEEAMRRFELLASAGAVISTTTAAENDTSSKKQQQSSTSTAASGSTMEVLDDSEDEGDEDEEDFFPDRELVTISLPTDEKTSSIQIRNFFFNDEHILPHIDVVGPPSSGGAAGQNLRSLWLKAAFRLVRAHEGCGNSWKALSVALSIYEIFSVITTGKKKTKEQKDKHQLPNAKEWKEIISRLFTKIKSPSVSKILQIPDEVVNYANKTSLVNYEDDENKKKSSPNSESTANTVTVAAPAIESWPSFQSYSAKRSIAWISSSATTKIVFAPLFGWSETHPTISKLQNFINKEMLLPILKQQQQQEKGEHHQDHCEEDGNSLENISKKLGVDSFAPFLLHMASLLLVSSSSTSNAGDDGEDAAKSLVVDGPVSLDRWLGRRPMFSYPEKTSRESDYFFVVAEVAAKLVQWVHELPEDKFDEFFFVDSSSSSSEIQKEVTEKLPSKLKNFAFVKERLVHVVFAFSQIAHATRSTRNISSSSNSSWCWLEAALIDTTSRVQYDTAVKNYIENGSSSSSSSYFKTNIIHFPGDEEEQKQDKDSSVFGTFVPSTWGEIEVELVNGDVNSNSGDSMLPVLFVDNAKSNAALPKRFDHAGFYGEIVVK